MSNHDAARSTRSDWVQTKNPLWVWSPVKPEISTEQGTILLEAKNVSDTLQRFLTDLNTRFSPDKPLTVIAILHSGPAFEIYLEVPPGIERRAFTKAVKAAWLRTPWGVGTVRVADGAIRWNSWKELSLFAPDSVTIPGLWTGQAPQVEAKAA